MPDAGRAVRVAILLIATRARGTVLHAMGADDPGYRRLLPGFLVQRAISHDRRAAADRLKTQVWTNHLMLFFSRRIGLSDVGRAIPIDWGTRLTGRVGKFTLGALTICRDGADESAPATFSVLRLRRDVLTGSDVGAMFLSCAESDGRANRVAAADVNFRFFRNLAVNSLVATSVTIDGDSAPGDRGALRAAATWQGGLVDVRGSYTSIGEQFRDDIGFVPQSGMEKGEVAAGAHLRPRLTSGWLREIYPHVGASRVARQRRGLQSAYVDSHILFMLHNGSLIDVGANPTVEDLASNFVINPRRDSRSGDLVDRAAIAKLTYMLAF